MSDITAFLCNYVFRYRRSVIEINLARSFPTLKYQEIKKIRKEYYKYMFDIAFESIWVVNASDKQISKMVKINNPDRFDAFCKKHNKIIVVMGHCGNWELLSGGIGVKEKRKEDSFGNNSIYITYKQLANKSFDELFIKMRMRLYKKFGNPGGLLESKNILRHVLKNKEEKSIYIFIADQSPMKERVVTKFLNQPTLMFAGAEYLATKLNLPMVYLGMNRVKRGEYEIDLKPICESPNGIPHGNLTRDFAALLEEDINNNKVNWLWSHKRWKKGLSPEEKEEYDRICL
jgi:Lauroyl/myristoyl acyltransferase